MKSQHMMISVSLILLLLYISSEGYELQCPDPSQWALRASSLCHYPSNYTCLLHGLENFYSEKCHYRPEGIGKGLKIVWQPKIHNGDCKPNRFQPFNFWTNENSDCALQKSKCSEEGQILVDNGTAAGDVSCRCDIDLGYIYLIEPIDFCSCVPSKEDCTCHLSRCSLDTVGVQCKHESTKYNLSKCPAVRTKIKTVGDTIEEPALVEKHQLNKAAAVTITVLILLVIIIEISLVFNKTKWEGFFGKKDGGSQDIVENNSVLTDANEHDDEEKLIDTPSKKFDVENNGVTTDGIADDTEDQQEAISVKNKGVEGTTTDNSLESHDQQEAVSEQNIGVEDTGATTDNSLESYDQQEAVSEQKIGVEDIDATTDNNLEIHDQQESVSEQKIFVEDTVHTTPTDLLMEEHIKENEATLNVSTNNQNEEEEEVGGKDDIGQQQDDNFEDLHGSWIPIHPEKPSAMTLRDDVKTGIVGSEPHNLFKSSVPSYETSHFPVKSLCSLPQDEIDARNRNIIKAMEERQKKFWVSKQLNAINELMENNAFVIITGASGDGKTAMTEHIAINLIKKHGFILQIIHTPEELDRYLQVVQKQVFIADDLFGKQSLDETALISWEVYTKKLKDTVSIENTKVIITIRSPIYEANKARINETMPTEAVFDFRLEKNQLTAVEKMAMIKQYVPSDKLSDDLEIQVNKQGYFPGFPLWCRLMYNEMKQNENFQINLCSPHIVMCRFVTELKQRNEYHFCSLVLSALNGGWFDVNNFSVCDRFWKATNKEDTNVGRKLVEIMRSCDVKYDEHVCAGKMKEAFKDLIQVYFLKEGSYYHVLHDSITDAIAKIYGDSNLHVILRYGSPSFVREYVRTNGAFDVDVLDVCIRLTPKYYDSLANRFLEYIENGYIVEVFLNPSISDQEFQSSLITALSALSNSVLTTVMYKLPIRSKCGRSKMAQNEMPTSDSPIYALTALHWVCSLGLVKVFSAIVNRFSKTFIEQLPGKLSLLHVAAGNGHCDIVRELVRIGVDVNAKSSLKIVYSGKPRKIDSGFTPLSYAACQNHPKVVTYLLQHDADPDIMTDNGSSPTSLAESQGYSEVVEMLLKYNKDPY